jgi:selenide, water dikinase
MAGGRDGHGFPQASAVGLDRDRRLVLTVDGEPVPYDLLSLDVGITPALDAIPGAAEHGIAVKPIADFVQKYDALMAAALRADGPRRIAVVGGGAGGVELLLSLQGRLPVWRRKAGLAPERFSFVLVTSGRLLATHNAACRKPFRRDLAGKGIALHEDAPVTAIEAGGLRACRWRLRSQPTRCW